MVEWVVFYVDGSSFSSEDGSPSDAPREGVQIIAQQDRGCGLRWVHSRDCYCWHADGRNGCWIGHNAVGLRRYLFWSDRGHEAGVVLSGYEVPVERWYEIASAAYADERLPIKTAIHPLDEPVPEDVAATSR